MKKTITVIEGEVKNDIYGSWRDCSPGLYIGEESVLECFGNYYGKKIRITIEEMDENKS